MQECVHLIWEYEWDSDICVQLLRLTLIAVSDGGDDRRGHNRIISVNITKHRDNLLKSLYGFMHAVYNILIWEKEEREISEKEWCNSHW